jgi:DNA-binding transcriptional MerR regulator
MLCGVSTLLSIGDFSRMTFLSVKALRHYHDVGLLPPAEIDEQSGYRRYDAAQIPTAQVIRRLRELGMSIDDVRTVIAAPDVDARNAAIGAHLRRMEGELEQTRETVRSLRLLLDEAAPPSIEIAYRAIGPSAVLAIRDDVAHADMFGWLDDALAELRTALGPGDALRAGSDAALYSPELLEEEFGEIVAFVPVDGTASPAGRVEMLQLPRVEYAVAVHSGPLEDADRTYAALGTVVAQRAIGVQGPIREDYVADDRIEIGWPVFQTT